MINSIQKENIFVYLYTFLQSDANLIQVKFANSRSQCLNMLSNPRCTEFKSLSENLSLMVFKNKTIKLDKAYLSGFTVLDISKVIFFEGIYKKIHSVFGSKNCYNNYVDTDSSIFTILDPDNNFLERIVAHRHLFDLSKLEQDHEIFKTNPHLPGL